jgi:tellurite resistance protein
MLIVWGFKVVFKVIGTGVFACPNCGGDRNYERRRAQKFFTLFWIPLIPLKVIGEVVRCADCKNDFRASVLERPVASQVADLLQNSVRGVMVNVLRRGAWNHPGARAAAIQEIALAGTVGYTEANLDADFQVVPEDLSPLLGPLAAQLPQSGREAMIAGAARVAAADGPVQPAERQLIDLVGAALGMTAAHVAGVVAQAAPGSAAAAGPAPAFGSPDPANMPTQAIRIPQQQGNEANYPRQ